MNRARNFSSCARFVMAMTVAFAPFSVVAADKEKTAEPPPPTGADFARLQREVAEQRQLIIEMMRVEQQRYDMLKVRVASAPTSTFTSDHRNLSW